jgi:hypothetical protein
MSHIASHDNEAPLLSRRILGFAISSRRSADEIFYMYM